MSNEITNAEQHLRETEHTLSLCEDNRRTLNQQVSSLRNQLRDSQNNEQQERQRLNQPQLKNTDTYEQARKDYDRAKEKFAQAQLEINKAEERYKHIEDDYRKGAQQTSQHLAAIEKKFHTINERLKTEIERKEQEERTWAMKAENARRDADLWRKRTEELKRQETEQLRRQTANTHRSSVSSHPSTRR